MPASDYSHRFISKGIGSDYRHRYPKIKIGFDVICLAVTACMTWVFLGHLDGLGIGTILAAFTMGKVIGIMGAVMDRKVQFVSFMIPKKAQE